MLTWRWLWRVGETIGRIVERPLRRRQEALQHVRLGQTSNTFIAELRDTGVSEVVSRAVFRRVQQLAVVEHFVVRREDVISDVFGVVGDDLIELADSILRDLGVPFPKTADTDSDKPIKTVQELAAWVEKYFTRPRV